MYNIHVCHMRAYTFLEIKVVPTKSHTMKLMCGGGGGVGVGVHSRWLRDLAMCQQNGETGLPGTLRRKNILRKIFMLGVNHQ